MACAAARKAIISAWAVGSLSRRTRFCPRAMIRPSNDTTAPMGTSPAASAARASSSAACIHSISVTVLHRRLLLGHAVQRTQSPDEVHAVDADNFVLRKDFSQRVERMA